MLPPSQLGSTSFSQVVSEVDMDVLRAGSEGRR